MKVALIGIMGAGKSTLGKLASRKLEMNFIDMDRYIEQKNNMTIEEMFNVSERYFRVKEEEALKFLLKKENIIISCGGGVIKKKSNIKLLRENAFVIYIDRPVNEIIEKIDCRNRPLLKENRQVLYDIYNERKTTYERACHYRLMNTNGKQIGAEKLATIIMKNKRFRVNIK